MKIKLEYEILQVLAKNVAHELKVKYDKEIKEGKFYLFAVMRGGATFGHLVSQRLGMPLGVVYPGAGEDLPFYFYPKVIDYQAPDHVMIYLEDVIAKGRTLQKVLGHHDAYLKCAREFVPVVMDVNVDPQIKAQVNICGIVTADWIVFPYEDSAHVIEGDRGLFRDGTSQNNQTQV
jgi:hypothetical protein